VCGDERRAPLERAHDAIRITRGEMPLFKMNPTFEQLLEIPPRKI